ncbi:MAG: dihydroorotase [Clostridia bacterium]|nr:dihydroorotase [Clostridia bacterium]
MSLLLKGAFVYDNGRFVVRDVMLDDLSVFSFGGSVTDVAIDLTGKYIFPGFADAHVHLREPGFLYKETVASGTAAAAAGGYTAVCSMPNLVPSPDCVENLGVQLDAIRRSARVRVYPYGTITVGSKGERLSDMAGMAADAVAFTDDGVGTTPEIMAAALKVASGLGKVVASHCEDVALRGGAHIAASPVAESYGIRGIDGESEYVQLYRELEQVARVGGAYHMCHLSRAKSVELIRQAKRDGLDVTCETGPHYIALDWNDITSDDGKYKMNPPLASPSDREAVIEGIVDGTIDMIATDHAPHSAEEKGKGLAGSMMGVVGLETAFPVCYTTLVEKGIISLEKLVYMMSGAARERFSLAKAGVDVGDFTVFDPGADYRVDPMKFLSMGKSTPFEGAEVRGECLMTVLEGRIIYMNERMKQNAKA